MSDASPRRGLSWFARWLHCYLSTIGFFVIVFFGATGLTLNHADWFESGEPVIREARGTVDPAWLARGEGEEHVAKLAIVERLRAEHGVRGAVSEFRVDDEQCVVVWKGPGYSADAFVDRASGGYELTETHKGAFAVLDDLHKGRDSGAVWAWVVDVAAIVTVICGITGLWLLWYVKRRRRLGLILALLGAVVPAVAWVGFVP